MAKRKRTDTFWLNTEEDNGDYFGQILDGQHELYQIVEEEVNLDYNKRVRPCWRVRHKITGNPVDGLRSTTAYRLALVWSVHTYPQFYKSSNRLNKVKAALPRIKTKRADHSRHRCGNEWCCNPCHILVGSRKDNEKDKHFHYFLRHAEQAVCIRFMDDFRELCKEQKVWGRYPVDTALQNT